MLLHASLETLSSQGVLTLPKPRVLIFGADGDIGTSQSNAAHLTSPHLKLAKKRMSESNKEQADKSWPIAECSESESKTASARKGHQFMIMWKQKGYPDREQEMFRRNTIPYYIEDMLHHSNRKDMLDPSAKQLGLSSWAPCFRWTYLIATYVLIIAQASR